MMGVRSNKVLSVMIVLKWKQAQAYFIRIYFIVL